VIFDFYWGTELHPSIFGVNIKQFTNCRFGMMSWGLIILSFAFKQNELNCLNRSMIVAVCLQLVYITKFFLWETGYFNSIDIMYDRAGYMICWGCLVWVPGFYTSSTLFLVKEADLLSLEYALVLLVLGLSAIFMNYFADLQRQTVRATNGNCLIFGKAPVLIEAEYKTENGTTHKSLLLCSGYWGIARHFHYVPEIIAAFCWSAPALFTSPMPYFYVVFLTVLLCDRAKRDELKCQKKYGIYYKEYCRLVPYKMLPYIY
jgi:7-dehydrocholesterol reductase